MLDDDAIEQISAGKDDIRTFLENVAKPTSMIVGPTGDILGKPVEGVEGITIADIDISESIILKEAHDIIGRYNRFDVFQLRVNQTRIKPIRLYTTASTFEEPTPSPCAFEEEKEED